MEGVLWYVFAGTRGGVNRARILMALDTHPRNAHQLAEDLDLNYKTVTHHLDTLQEHDVVESEGEEYGTVYFPTDRVRANWDTIEEIIHRLDDTELDPESTGHGSVDGEERNRTGSAESEQPEDELEREREGSGENRDGERDDTGDTPKTEGDRQK